MARKGTKQYEIEKAYNRERRRITRRIAAYTKEGLIVSIEVPNIPKRITQASVNRLAKINLKAIRDKTEWFDPLTESKKSYKEYAKLKRKLSRTKGVKEKERVIEVYEEWLTELMYKAPNAMNDMIGVLMQKMDKIRKMLGDDDFIKMIEIAVKNDSTISVGELYGGENYINQGIHRMLAPLNVPLTDASVEDL